MNLADIRGIAMDLPGVTEQLKSRRRAESIHWEVGRRMFAKFGEASNLLAPDVSDTLMIRCCEDRAALLVEHADRFFITTHYGDPGQPGAILTRLSENTRRDLPELAELMEESWRQVAPKRLAATRSADSPAVTTPRNGKGR